MIMVHTVTANNTPNGAPINSNPKKIYGCFCPMFDKIC